MGLQASILHHLAERLAWRSRSKRVTARSWSSIHGNLRIEDCNIHGLWAYLADPKLRLAHLLPLFLEFTFGHVPISISFHRKVHLLEQGGAQVVPLHPAMEDWTGHMGVETVEKSKNPRGSPILLKDKPHSWIMFDVRFFFFGTYVR
jgi:hypothetical protein